MKTSRLLVLILPLLVCVAKTGFAHPPTAIDLSYNEGQGQLEVLVQHPVNDPKDHYINQVVVMKNGAQVATKSFTSQTSHRNQTMPPFTFAAAKGDVIEVSATCNEFGTRKQKLTVGDPQKPPRG